MTMTRAALVSLFVGSVALAAPPPTPEPTPKEAAKVLEEAALKVLETPDVSAAARLRPSCQARGGCTDASDAAVKTFFLADAARIRPKLSAAESDRLDCSLATLGFTGPADKACQRADASLAGNVADALGMVAADMLVPIAARACGELVTCARGCTVYLYAVSDVEAKERAAVPRCPDAKKVPAAKLDAWLLARTTTWLRTTLPFLDADGQRRVNAALAKHAK
jgi:hypothetical protein